MRQTAMILAIAILVVSLAAPAMAVEPRAVTIIPDLTFDGTTATCAVSMSANTMSDYLVAYVKLWHGTNIVASWSRSGNGYIFFTETAEVVKGYTYRLTVDLVVNGSPCSQVGETGTCK